MNALSASKRWVALSSLGLCFALAGLPASAGVMATGGTVTNYMMGGFSYAAHIFTAEGTSNLTVTAGGDVEVLVVGAGGGGGETIGGGGGGGGVVYTSSYAVAVGDYTVVVGEGGAGGWGTGYPAGVKGGNSVFATLTAIGGGAGAGYNLAASGVGGSAGGNGGAGGLRAGYTPAQGKDGGIHWNNNAGGGGGGSGQAGTAGTSSSGGNGGDGRAFDISGVNAYYGGGGGGGTRDNTGPNPGAGGPGEAALQLPCAPGPRLDARQMRREIQIVRKRLEAFVACHGLIIDDLALAGKRGTAPSRPPLRQAAPPGYGLVDSGAAPSCVLWWYGKFSGLSRFWFMISAYAKIICKIMLT